MQLIKHCEALVAKHNKHISLVALSLLSISVLGLGFPMMLLAQEGLPTTSPHASYDFTPRPPLKGQNFLYPSDRPEPLHPQNISDDENHKILNTPASLGDHDGRMLLRSASTTGGQLQLNNDQFKKLHLNLGPVENALKQVQNQIERLSKQGIAVSSTIADTISQLQAIIAGTKGAKTATEASGAGVGDLPSLIRNLQSNEATLEKTARWSASLKQADQTLKSLNKLVLQDKALAEKLTKNGFDVSEQITQLTTAVTALQAARDLATTQITTDANQAFAILQNGFFEKLDSVKQADLTIKQLANVSKFTAQFKSSSLEITKMIAGFKAHNLDTTSLEAVWQQMQDKGAAISALIQAKPLDTKALSTAFADLQQLRMQLQDIRHTLIGDDAEKMPWDQGKDTFNLKPLLKVPSILPTSTSADTGTPL